MRHINIHSVFDSIYVDKSKVKKIADKSGAAAELLDLYTGDGSHKLDIYQDRWPFAEHMDFFIPACARTAHTVSIGDKKSATSLKSKPPKDTTAGDDTEYIDEEFLLDVCLLLQHVVLI